MRNKFMILSLISGLLLTTAVFGADKFTIDQAHSSIEFSVRHLVISNVTGKFKDFSGTLMFDENDITKSSIEVTIKTESLDTENNDRDNHLRSPDFFDAAKYPEITFKSNGVVKSKDGQYMLHGILDMHEVKKEISIPFEFIGKVVGPRGKTRLGFEGSTKIDRQDFGIAWNKVLDNGGLIAGNEIKITLNIEAIAM
jgi:polyisoprenoid-binding protein YceI